MAEFTAVLNNLLIRQEYPWITLETIIYSDGLNKERLIEQINKTDQHLFISFYPRNIESLIFFDDWQGVYPPPYLHK